MGEKKAEKLVCKGTVESDKIYEAHMQIRDIVEKYKNANYEVASITNKINENWVGEGRNEFESQYKLLIKKIDDFGEALQEIYDALVDAEAEFGGTDETIRQQFTMAMQE